MRVAIVGATGAVGRQMLTCLKERKIDCEIKLLASKKSAGKVIDGLTVEELKEDSFKDVDYVLGATENNITKTWIDNATKQSLVIDNSSSFRLDKDVPLVVPEINKKDVTNTPRNIIANPNCATAIGLMATYPLYKEFGIKRMIVTTFQAVSGAGKQGIDELDAQIKDSSYPPNIFPYPIAFNIIPQIGDFDELGISKEEWKLQNESRKIMHDDKILVNCTCVRIPVYRCHSESITIECEKEVDLAKARELIKNFPGVILEDDPQNKKYPMPLMCSDKDDVYVGRIRKDISDPTGHSISLFCCGDQIRKGAATNAVQILEEVIKNKAEVK